MLRALVARSFDSQRLRGSIAIVSVGLAWVVGLSTEPLTAQDGVTTRVFHLRETVGIRRTEYPATVTVQLPKGALTDAGHARVMNNSQELPAQFTARTPWDDGSVQTLDIDLGGSSGKDDDRPSGSPSGGGNMPKVVEQDRGPVKKRGDQADQNRLSCWNSNPKEGCRAESNPQKKSCQKGRR